jgi:hypothetical protein
MRGHVQRSRTIKNTYSESLSADQSDRSQAPIFPMRISGHCTLVHGRRLVLRRACARPTLAWSINALGCSLGRATSSSFPHSEVTSTWGHLKIEVLCIDVSGMCQIIYTKIIGDVEISTCRTWLAWHCPCYRLQVRFSNCRYLMHGSTILLNFSKHRSFIPECS